MSVIWDTKVCSLSTIRRCSLIEGIGIKLKHRRKSGLKKSALSGGVPYWKKNLFTTLGGDYSRGATIQGNTVFKIIN